MRPPTCYRCGSDRTHRLLLGPYVCDRCGHQFIARDARARREVFATARPRPTLPQDAGRFVQLSQPRGDL